MGIDMHMPFTSNNISDSARHYVERIGSLYARARAMIGRASHDHDTLQNWQWHRASAEACLDEAVLIYLEGLEGLLQAPVSVRLEGEARAPAVFACQVGADKERVFRFADDEGPAAALDDENQRRAVETLFGKVDREVLDAFAEGLCQLRQLGEFGRSGRIKLSPEARGAADEAITAPAG
jgi:hypothetical protein